VSDFSRLHFFRFSISLVTDDEIVQIESEPPPLPLPGHFPPPESILGISLALLPA